MIDYIDNKTAKGLFSHNGMEDKPNILLVTMDMENGSGQSASFFMEHVDTI